MVDNRLKRFGMRGDVRRIDGRDDEVARRRGSGRIHVGAAARELLPSLLPAGHPYRLQVERFLEERAAADTARFRAYWLKKFDRPGRESVWDRFAGRLEERVRK